MATLTGPVNDPGFTPGGPTMPGVSLGENTTPATWQFGRHHTQRLGAGSLGENTDPSTWDFNQTRYDRATGQPIPGTGHGPSSTPGVGGTQDQNNAYQYVSNLLTQYGLGTLGTQAWQMITSGMSSNPDYIIQQLRATPEYQQRFAGIIARQKAGLPPISEGDYVNYENQAHSIAHAANLPDQFITPDLIAKWIGGDVSINEVQDRIVNNGYAKLQDAPAEVRQAFQNYFGPSGDGALASYFLDPNRSEPLLSKQVAAAEMGGTAKLAGLNLGSDQASTLAQSGISELHLRAGLGNIAQVNPIFTQLTGEQPGLNAATTGVQAFLYQNAGAQQQIQNALSQRQAQFAQGGGAGISQTGENAGAVDKPV